MISARLRPCAIAGLVAIIAGPASAQDLLPTPYQVEGLVSYREPYRVEGLTRYQDAGTAADTLVGPYFVVDLGRAGDRPPPANEIPGAVTIVGTDGHVLATLHDLVKTCEHPCGPAEGEECHYSAQYRPEGSIATIGTPLIAIPGRHELDRYRRASGRPVPLASLVTDLSSTLWDDRPRYGLRGWSREMRQVTIASDRPHLDGLRWSDCSVSGHEDLQLLQCGPGNGALLSEGRPLLVSMEQGILVVAAWFDAGGLTYAVVQRGYTVGLVVRGAQGWLGLARPAGHALTCG